MSKRNIFFLAIIAIGLIILVFPTKDNQKETSEVSQEELVMESFAGYRDAIISLDGDKAITYLSKNTVEYYDLILDLVKTGAPEEIAERQLIDVLNVLIIRTAVESSVISNLKDGYETIVLSIDMGLIGDQSVNGTSIDKITINGDRAVARILDASGASSGAQMDFVKEGRVWKIDLLPIINGASVELGNIIEESELSTDAYIVNMLKLIAPEKDLSEIWTPIDSIE